MKNSKLVSLCAIAFGALGVLGAATQEWFTFVIDEGAASSVVAVSGVVARPLLSAISLGILAAVAALLLGTRVIRLIIFGLTCAMALGAATATATALMDPVASSVASLSAVTGVADTGALEAGISSVTLSLWPWMALFCLAAVGLGSLFGLFTSWRWASNAQRYSVPKTRVADANEPEWDTLSNGSDPTR